MRRVQIRTPYCSSANKLAGKTCFSPSPNSHTTYLAVKSSLALYLPRRYEVQAPHEFVQACLFATFARRYDKVAPRSLSSASCAKGQRKANQVDHGIATLQRMIAAQDEIVKDIAAGE